jgi:ribose 5-phosphate isomerase A
MVELASKKFVCIVDDTKMVSGLGGSKLAMPVEVTPFCYKVCPCQRVRACTAGASLAPPRQYNLERLTKLPETKGCTAKACGAHTQLARTLTLPARPQLRMKGDEIYVTDNANYIIDLYFETPMKDSVAAGAAISALVGVVEHGLFLNMCDVCIIAGKTGIEIKERKLVR